MPAATAHHPAPHGRPRRIWLAVAAALVGGVALAALASGWDAGAWLHAAWRSFRSISAVYLVPVLALQTLQLLLSAYAWFRILEHAYPDRVGRREVLACCSAGAALNSFLPANAGTLVTLLMLVAVIEPATLAGVVGSAAVEKLFWAFQALLLWAYLFFAVGGTFALKFGAESRHPWVTTLVVLVLVGVVAVVARVGWRWLRRTWEQAKHGGAILGDRRAYVRGVFVPQLASWWCRAAGIAVLFLAFGIPLGFERVMLVLGGNTLGSNVSVTPGGIGVNQALSVASLHGATSSATAGAFSITQQLLTTAWNVVLALVFLVAAFGWAGGRRLLAQTWGGARDQLRERLS